MNAAFNHHRNLLPRALWKMDRKKGSTKKIKAITRKTEQEEARVMERHGCAPPVNLCG